MVVMLYNCQNAPWWLSSSEIMIQIVIIIMAGYHIRLRLSAQTSSFHSVVTVGHLKKGRRGWLKIKRFLNQDDYFSQHQHEGSILSLVLQPMPSLQTKCFVHRLLNCKSDFKISLSCQWTTTRVTSRISVHFIVPGKIPSITIK